MQKHLPNITEPIMKWFEMNKRELPWRNDREPYHVWISEIMLQQTRIEAVKKYYVHFMQELPDIKSLSVVPEDQLLKLWEGLGYYSRARNLKKAAEMIMFQYNGEFPHSYEQLLTLPGIGEYTAGAIASICFNEKVTAVDGNVLRVTARILGSKKNVLLTETKKEAVQLLLEKMPPQSGTFNEALMELGELICLPNGIPLCGNCPLKENCIACKEHLTSEIPVREKKLKRRKEQKSVFLIVSHNKMAIEKRPSKGLLSGMYQLPNIEGFHTENELYHILKDWNVTPEEIAFIKETKHIFTHIDWYMKGYRVTVNQQYDRFLWVSPEELSEQYALPTAFQLFLNDSQ